MSSFPILADMNISPLTVRALRDAGWEASRVSDHLDDDAPDASILAYAAEHDQVVCTQDLDFSALLAVAGHDRPSLITLRLTDTAPRIVTARLLRVLPAVTEDVERGAVVTIEDEAVRVRSLPIQE